MSSPLYRRLFPDEVHHEDGLAEEIGRWLPPTGRLLDLGCGDNAFLAPHAGPRREAWGADFAAHPQLTRREWFRPLGRDGRVPFPDHHFDLIVSVMVLEHVGHPRRFLAEVARVLRPGGAFVAHTINGTHYVTWVRRLLGFLPHSWVAGLVRRVYGRAEFDTFPTYYRLNRDDQVAQACRGSGLTLAGVRRYATPCYFHFNAVALAAATWLDWSLEKLRPGLGRLYTTFTLQKPAQPAALRPAA